VAKPSKPEDFRFSHDDPLAKEHTAVAAWVEDAISSFGARQAYH
jgi:hypothetical protein